MTAHEVLAIFRKSGSSLAISIIFIIILIKDLLYSSLSTWGVAPGAMQHTCCGTYTYECCSVAKRGGGLFALLSMLDMSLLCIKYLLCDIPCQDINFN